MNKEIRTIRDIVYISMCVLMVVLLYLYLSEIFLGTDKRNYKCIAYILAICLADYIFRKYITNAILFFSARLLFIPAILAVTIDGTQIMLLSIIFFAFYWMGITFWKSGDSDKRLFAVDMPIEGIVLFIGIYFHASLDMSAGLANYAYISGIIYILFHLIRLYLDRFIQISLNMKNDPASLSHSFRMNSSFIFIFILCFVLFIWGINLLLNDNSFNFVGTIIKFVLSVIFGFFSRFKNVYITEEPESATIPIQDTGNENATTASPSDDYIHQITSNPIANAIFNAFQIILYIGIVVAILFIIYKFFKTYMYRNRKTDDVIEKVDIKDKTDAKRSSPKKGDHIFLNNREKIRKIYRKTITNKLKHNNRIKICRSNTPVEIHSVIVKGTDCSPTDLKVLTDIYEKARYSNQDITSEDVGFIKALNN